MVNNRLAFKVLMGVYYTGRILGVVNWRLKANAVIIAPLPPKSKALVIIWRLIVYSSFGQIIPDIFKSFSDSTESPTVKSLIILQTTSIVIFAIFTFITQVQAGSQTVVVLRKFIKAYQQIVAKTPSSQILGAKFLWLLLIKTIATAVGYMHEIPRLVKVNSEFWFEFALDILTAIFGIYIWIGSMMVLDGCFLGFLILSNMYGELGNYLQRLLSRMEDELELENNEKRKKPYTKYQRMLKLCECADTIDEMDQIYTDLYEITKEFHRLFQWHILYYIYYNFSVTLFLCHQCIWMYLNESYVDFIGIFMVVIKIGNLALLIMCANNVVINSQRPELLCLDVVCSGIDDRWDTSVECFICQRQVENLEIKVLGFFQLNNEFILIILSAIISYLFVLIQFGLSGQ